jgi:hypothetical protein
MRPNSGHTLNKQDDDQHLRIVRSFPHIVLRRIVRGSIRGVLGHFWSLKALLTGLSKPSCALFFAFRHVLAVFHPKSAPFRVRRPAS